MNTLYINIYMQQYETHCINIIDSIKTWILILWIDIFLKIILSNIFYFQEATKLLQET